MHILRNFGGRMAAALAFTAVASLPMPLDARTVDSAMELQERLARGEVVVGSQTRGDTKFVTGTIQIDQPPEKVWPIVSNPYEFQGKISPRMKSVEVIVDKANLSVMKVYLDMTLMFPNFNYVVESHYESGQRINFHRVGGTLRDFKGTWEFHPLADGKGTECTYSMYIDPGFFVPQWIMREGVKGELPRTLKALRKRVNAVCNESERPTSHTILAAGLGQHEHEAVETASSHQSVF